MSITQEEKEQLFEEFKERLKNEQKQGYASGYETYHNLEKAKDYFWEKYRHMTDKHSCERWLSLGISSGDWDFIRKLICHANGTGIVRDISPDKLDESNELAIRIIDLLFDYNEQILNEKESQ